ncbi:hypothetical protein AN639_12690 [Candidatus Epulonipiscium fishelsonii]|uniref:Uncharacterized protein n=1 Tax=Candidatus Epulonipiscium fishelsonii TaxID=77094 RepID=A0ACC8XGF4_9FIRM|nr:hypothetical protein AN639_12690 [Epulopiscium sp. SCG-B05WGA-EpuloA1]ONI42703.1 hypothetical protein AN396_13510 [Epulopiscium sp. SCG-B11WGA-EpuloA1]ONI47026.1 hypothetical protein AN644_01870 [Epulopiscium sp. SCG-C06WGA-EpuloA1]
MIKWNDKYLVGIDIVDTQHKQLFIIAQEAEATLKSTHIDKYYEIMNILNELRKYTEFHFLTEEKLMEQTNYSNLHIHKTEHDAFIHKIISVLDELDEESDDVALKAILIFIIDWISEHIRLRDKDMSNYILNL